MTLSADPGVGDFKEPVIVRTVRVVTVGTVLNGRRMLPKERPSSFRMAHETGLIDACLFELGRIGSPVRVMAVGAGHFPFFQRHMRTALELSLSLQVTLAAHLYLGPLVEEGIFVTDLGKLEAVRGPLHDCVAVGANNSTSSMGACLPISLHSLLMALQAGFVLDAGGHW